MGDSSVEVSEENRDASQEAKAKGMEAISDGLLPFFMWSYACYFLIGANWLLLTGKLEEAIEHLTEAILLNPTSAIMYATRGTTEFEFWLNFYIFDYSFLSVISFNFFSLNKASVYIKMKKPNAAIRDADAALQVVPFFHICWQVKWCLLLVYQFLSYLTSL